MRSAELSSIRAKSLRCLLWCLTLAAWLAFIIPGFSDKAAKNEKTPAVLPVQSKIQVIAAGKLLRLQDSGLMPKERSRDLDGTALDMLENALSENKTSQYIICHKALLFMHRGDYPQAQKLLESIVKPEKSLAAVVQAGLSTCRSSSGQNGHPRPETIDSLLLQESINRELNDYWQTIARRELADYARLEPPQPELDASDLRRLKRDIFWIAVTSAVVLINFLVCPAWLLCVLAAKLRQERQPGPGSSVCSPDAQIKFDPLKVCAAYVFLQWMMVLLAIWLSRYFVFHAHKVAAVFCTYTCTYTVLIAILFYLLPHLRDKSGDDDNGTPFLIPEVLQLGPMRRQDWLWGWIGFAAAMAAAFIISQITAVCSGHTPRSDNPFLAVAAQSRPSEWLLLILQLSVCGPFFEELLFRGLLFRGLRSCWPTFLAAAVSSALFGITHFDPQGTFVLAGLGLCFTFVYYKSGRLWSAIIAHGLWNGFVAFNLLMAVR